MLTFVGKGYTAPFTENYRLIAARLSSGEDILVVEGPDDICGPLLQENDAHCFRPGVTERDWTAALAVESVLGRTAEPGATIAPDAEILQRLRSAFRSGAVRKSCDGCEWSELCTDIAASGFDGVLVVSG